ncbi:uncharacterized protein LOC121854369 [Homarus americanus]|uniref:C2H2-type domain-containing protein n=1 Tax=Homarus americanus TaxID=6706 RepID=A0A8J5JE79_HOMAM|nr:uncharacterized protein LOC121854369 [Homarus americanus]KAG7155926.1 hypothetical protein Hamer_G012069 [Homarus americanus]
MVDWETSKLELHAGRMHVVAKDSSSFPVNEMLQDDETELNVMDFVETEYKSEKCEDLGIRQSSSGSPENHKRMRVKISRKDLHGEVDNECDARTDSVSLTTDQVQVKIRKKNKFAKNPTLTVEPSNNLDVSLHYPYATCLKSLCDEVGDVQIPSSDSFSMKIFDQLRQTDVHYPYASLLEELHQNAEAESTNIPSTLEESFQQDSLELGIADVMRSLHYPTRMNENSSNFEDSAIESFEAPFSTMLLGMVMQQKIQDYARNQSDKVNSVGDFRGIGEILKTSMPKSLEDDPPPSELHSSALLRKLSLLAQQNQEMTKGSSFHDSSDDEREQILLWSTSESSHSEDDDLEWKPTNWKSKQVTTVVNIPKKRKSRRKKKGVIEKHNNVNMNVPSSSQDYCTNTGQKHSSSTGEFENEFLGSPSVAPSRLLQLIMGSVQNDSRNIVTEESHRVSQVGKRKNKSCRQSLRRSKRKTKRKSVINNIQRDNCDWKIRLQNADSSLKNKRQVQNEEILSVINSEAEENDPLNNLSCTAKTSEPQSLLKEYLLKPAGEEITPIESCDIPKVETNFLFSRLLQNFKSLAESSHSDNNPERRQESRSSPSILRGMLVGGNNSNELQRKNHADEETQDSKNFIEHINVSAIRNSPSQDSLFDSTGSLCKVKCEQEIKIELQDEVVCKIECDEDSFECQVCHLQFSSGMDLSNHQILFHCNEDPQSSSSHKLLPCSVDGLPNNVLQEKLPA